MGDTDIKYIGYPGCRFLCIDTFRNKNEKNGAKIVSGTSEKKHRYSRMEEIQRKDDKDAFIPRKYPEN